MTKWCGKCRKDSDKRAVRVGVLGKTHKLLRMYDKGFVFKCLMAVAFPVTDGKPAWVGRVES